MNFSIKGATLYPQFNVEKNFHVYMTQLFSLVILKTIKDYNRNQRLEINDPEREFRAIINGGVALKSYFPKSEEFVTTDYDLFMFAPKYYEKIKENLEAYSEKQKEIASMFMENCEECFNNLIKQGIFEIISEKEILVKYFPSFRINLILKDGKLFSSPFLKNFKPSPKEPMHVEINYAYIIYKENNDILFAREEALVEVINFLNDEDITAQEPDFSPAALKKFYGEKYRRKPTDKSGFFMNFKHPAGRKGFYKQYFYSVCLEDDIYVASLGYLLWSTMNDLNRYFDAVSNLQSKPHNYESIVGTLFHDPKYPYDGKNPNSSNKFKFERVLMKYNAIIKLLSDPRYLNSYTLEGFMNNHKKVVDQEIDGCPLTVLQDGVKRRGFADKKEELVEIILRSGIFPPFENIKKILMDFSFDTLCSYVRESVLIEN